jgi:molybdopterin converting factor small subunit
MQVTLHIPAALREHAGGARDVCADVAPTATVGELLGCLRGDYPGVVERALDEQGMVRQHVNVFVDGESIRAGAALGLATPVRPGSEVWILAAVSGG